MSFITISYFCPKRNDPDEEEINICRSDHKKIQLSQPLSVG